jgi:hypothetical protein
MNGVLPVIAAFMDSIFRDNDAVRNSPVRKFYLMMGTRLTGVLDLKCDVGI